MSKYSNFYNLLLFKFLFSGQINVVFICAVRTDARSSSIDNLHNPKTQEITRLNGKEKFAVITSYLQILIKKIINWASV